MRRIKSDVPGPYLLVFKQRNASRDRVRALVQKDFRATNVAAPPIVFPERLSPQFFKFNPLHPEAPALHTPIIRRGILPGIVGGSVDLYVGRRDRLALAARRPVTPDVRHIEAFQNIEIITVPGWGNFTFGTNVLNYLEAVAGRGATHLSVTEEGRFNRYGDAAIIGSARMALAAEWTHEFRTVVYRVWSDLQKQKYDQGAFPKRHLLLGHSKGGLLVYLLASLAKAVKTNDTKHNLDKFIEDLCDESGQQILKGIPRSCLEEVAEGLQNAVFGALGSPLYGIDDGVATFADTDFLGFGFNSGFDGSARGFTKGFMKKLQGMTGYAPPEALNFVFSSELEALPGIHPMTAIRGAMALGRLIRDPILEGGDFFFKFAGRAISGYQTGNKRHDAVVSMESAGAGHFEDRRHIHLVGPTHLEHVEDETVMRHILDQIILRGIL